MATANTAANSAAVLKTAFEGGDPSWSAREESKLLSEISTDNTYGGDDSAAPIAVRLSMGAGVSANFNVAQAGATAAKFVRFAVPLRKLYGMKYLDGEFIERTKSSTKSYLDAMKSAIKEGRWEYNSVLAQQVWSKSGGHVAQLSATQVLTGATITFTNDPYTTSLFEIGRQYTFASDDGTAVSPAGERDNGRYLTVTNVSVETGVVTFDANVNTVSGVAVSDYIHLRGNYAVAMDGILAWLPITAPTATAFRGVDRSVAPNKLAGYRFSGGGGRISDTIRYALAESRTAGVRVKRLYMNPTNVQDLASEVQTYSTIPLGMADAKLGHTGFKFASSGDAVVVEEAYVPKGYVIGLDPADWRLWCTPSGMGHIQNVDSLQQRYVENADALLIRYAGYTSGVCPKANGKGPGNGLIITL